MIFSGYALLLNRKRTKIIIEQDKERKQEKNKASLSIERIKEDGRKSPQHYLVVKNTGKATARNIQMKIENKTGVINPLLESVVTEIHGGDSVKYLFLLHGGTSLPYTITLKWEDKNQTENEKIITVI